MGLPRGSWVISVGSGGMVLPSLTRSPGSPQGLLRGNRFEFGNDESRAFTMVSCMLRLLESKVKILYLGTSPLPLVVLADKSVVINHCFEGNQDVPSQLNGSCVLDWRQGQVFSADVLKENLIFFVQRIEVCSCVAVPVHAKLLRVEEDSFKTNWDLHFVEDRVVEVCHFLYLIVFFARS